MVVSGLRPETGGAVKLTITALTAACLLAGSSVAHAQQYPRVLAEWRSSGYFVSMVEVDSAAFEHDSLRSAAGLLLRDNPNPFVLVRFLGRASYSQSTPSTLDRDYSAWIAARARSERYKTNLAEGIRIGGRSLFRHVDGRGGARQTNLDSSGDALRFGVHGHQFQVLMFEPNAEQRQLRVFIESSKGSSLGAAEELGRRLADLIPGLDLYLHIRSDRWFVNPLFPEHYPFWFRAPPPAPPAYDEWRKRPTIVCAVVSRSASCAESGGE